MNEYKALAKEDWVNIEVRLLYLLYGYVQVTGSGFGGFGGYEP